jgi:epoxide hydrolase-like predicted phosphatase
MSSSLSAVPAGPTAPRAVIFDFGAVLFRWRPAALLARVLPELARDEASTRALVVGFFQGYGGDWGRFDRGTIGVDELAHAISRRLHDSLGVTPAHAHAVIAAVPDELAPIADSVALLQRLHAAGLPLFYLSNMPAPYADHLERSHGFMACFQAGVFSSRVGLCKPEPEIFQLALQRFGLAPGEAVFLDDHAPNIAAAQTLGLPGVLFSDTAQAAAELRAMGLAVA